MFIKKNKGMTLIETIVSMAILVIVIGVLINMVVAYNKVLHSRIAVERLNRELYSVSQELKYNYTIEEILEKTEDTKISIKRNDDLLEMLLEKSLFDLESGDGVFININNISDEIISMNIKIEGEVNGVTYSVDDEFNKTRWMDEVR